MADRAHSKTDELIAEMEAKLDEIYMNAGRDVEAKAAAYFKKFAELDEKKKALVSEGKITESEYIRWRKNKMLYGEHWKRLENDLALKYLATNQTAIAYVNGKLPGAYALNYNYSMEDIASQVSDLGGDYHFELVDAQTVKNLAVSDETLLPHKYINGVRDARWNTQKVNSAVLQGILVGDSVSSIARRLRTVTEMNRTSAVRNARTAVTSAECKGRQDSYERAEADGIKLRREWMAAIDGRTRHAHRLLDGQIADVDKPFKSELGDIMYPGDPKADPANIYNCRCTVAATVVSIDGVKVDDEGYEEREYADRRTAQDFYNKDPKRFDKMQKILYNESADKKQYAKYKKRLGSEAPRKFSDFQKMKYDEAEKYGELKLYYRYKGRVPEATRANFETAQRIKAKGIIGTIRVPAAKIDISNLTAVNDHAFRHGCTIEDAKKYIKNAKVSITRTMWDGVHTNYYSVDGAVYLNSEKKINTIYSSESFKGDTPKIIEEVI